VGEKKKKSIPKLVKLSGERKTRRKNTREAGRFSRTAGVSGKKAQGDNAPPLRKDMLGVGPAAHGKRSKKTKTTEKLWTE